MKKLNFIIWLVVFFFLFSCYIRAQDMSELDIGMVPCNVLSANKGTIICASFGDNSMGEVFAFDYVRGQTRARFYPRYGRKIVIYFYFGNYQPYVLYDWFLLKPVKQKRFCDCHYYR